MSNRDTLVVSIHTEDDKRSSYVKVSIKDSGNEIINFIRTISDVKLVRFHDYTQCQCVLECRKNGFTVLDPSYETVIDEALRTFTDSIDKEIIKNVEILNFWMSEPYNNLNEMKKIIEHHNLGVYAECWIDKTN